MLRVQLAALEIYLDNIMANIAFYGQNPIEPLRVKSQRDFDQDSRRRMAQQLAMQGGSMAPVQSHTEGIARALQGGLSGLLAGKARRDKEDRDKALDLREKAYSGGLNAVTTALTNPVVEKQRPDPEFVGPMPARSGMEAALAAIPAGNSDFDPLRSNLALNIFKERKAKELLEDQRAYESANPPSPTGRPASPIQLSNEYDMRVLRDGKKEADIWYKKYVNPVFLNTGNSFVSRADVASGVNSQGIPIKLKPGEEIDYKKDLKTAEAEVKAESDKKALDIKNVKAMSAFEVGLRSVEETFSKLKTDPITGLFPALTEEAQKAEGSVSAMAPILKSLFRESGEGVFTDKDQELLTDMAPKRTDHPAVVAYKINMLKEIVGAKLGQSTGQVDKTNLKSKYGLD